MNCFICGEAIEAGYLCKRHAKELYELLMAKKNTIQQPDFKRHCQLCGEYENRIIVEYPLYGYFCDKDILEEWERISRSK